MKHKSSVVLPISPANWDALKRNIPGLEDATRSVQRVSTQDLQLLIRSIKIFEVTADYNASMRILEDNGLRPLGLHEALCAIIHNPKLKKKLKPKGRETYGRFYIEGNFAGAGSTAFNELVRICNDGCLSLEKSKDPELGMKIWKGYKPQSLLLLPDSRTSIAGFRFILDAAGNSREVTHMVVGVPLDMQEGSINEAARRM